MSMTSAPGDPETGASPESDEPSEPGAASPEGPAPRGQRYGLLLILLIATYLLSAFTTGTLVNAAQIVVFVGTLLLALRSALVARWIGLTIFGVVVIGSAVALGVVLSGPSKAAIGAADIWTGLVLLIAVVVIVHRILGNETVTLQSIYGAVSAYMIIGLMFAAFYGAMDRLGEAPFFANGQPGNTRTFQYFSFTTLTTLGYGDFTAAGNAGRAVAVMEAMFGQIFLATLVARLVSAFQRPARRK
jgi:Ion channel